MKVATSVLLLLHLTTSGCYILIPEILYFESPNPAGDPLQMNQTEALTDGISMIRSGMSSAQCASLAGAIESLEEKVLSLQGVPPKTSFVDPEKKTEEKPPVECRPPFVPVGGSCLYLDLTQRLTWSKGRLFCQLRGADLVVFKDANTFEAIIKHINSMNAAKTLTHFWIGGSDIEQEGNWVWIDGEPMPRGTPYWGTVNGNLVEPAGGRGENCAILYYVNAYYLHDLHCQAAACAPLCQYFPTE